MGVSGLLLLLLPLASGVLCRFKASLLDMTAGPFLLVLLLAAFKIICDATMNNLVSNLKVILVSVSYFSHVFILPLTIYYTNYYTENYRIIKQLESNIWKEAKLE